MYLYGASGHAKVVIDVLLAQGIPVDGLFDDNESVRELLGYPVFHGEKIESPLIVSIGLNSIRKKIVDSLNVKFGTAIHPSAIFSGTAVIGEGSVVMQGAITQSCVNIGKHCIINTGASIDHDCQLGDFVHISPHATLCGNVSIDEGTWIGAGAIVVPGIKIGKWSVIGAGSVVLADIPDGVVAVGNPCKVIKNMVFQEMPGMPGYTKKMRPI